MIAPIMTTDPLFAKIAETYEVEFFECLDDYLQLPINSLYLKLSPFKKDIYADNYRLVFYTFGKVDQSLYSHLQKVLAQLDIPNFFVLVVSNRAETAGLLEYAAQHYARGDAPISHMFFSAEPVSSPINVTNFDIPDSVCINHWINLEITNSGDMAPCCKFKGVLKDSNNVPFHVNSSSFNEVVKSDHFKSIRLNSLNGELAAECNACWSEEKLGKNSKRILDYYVYRDAVGANDWNNLEPNIQSLDIKLGYTCNLGCRICNPDNSSFWSSEVKRSIKLQDFYEPKRNTADWTSNFDSIFWQNFKELGDSIKYLQFTGGEPFLIKKHFLLLEHLIDSGKAKNINLHYNTNGTIYPEEAIPIWDKFKSVEISFSIDNIGPKFEYERYGDSWQNVNSNIKRFLKLPRYKFTFNMFSTIWAINVADMFSLYKYSTENGIDIVYNILTRPDDMSISVLPVSVRKQIIESLLESDDIEFKNKINPIILKLQTEAPSGLMDLFWKRMSLLDESRKQQFSECYPDLYNLLNKK